MSIPERLKKLRIKMEEKGVDVYIVPTADFHQNEYVGEQEEYAKVAEEKQAKVAYHEDLIDLIWEDRPELSKASAFSLGVEYAGETAADKLKRIREKMEKAGANVHVLTTLDDICWTLNIRGDDIEFFPLVLSYAIIRMDSMELYVDENKLNDEIKAQLNELNVHLHPYNDIYEDIRKLDGETVALIDPGKLNYALYNNIPENDKKVEAENPTMLMKSAKNPVEVENIRKAQIKDSVAHVRFMKWLKENVGKTRITEMSATEKLDELRAEMGNFIRPSFEPIASYGEHGAIVHYISTPETDVELKEGNFFMTDTGAGFWEGSTDVTRLLNIHESPASFRWRYVKGDTAVLQEGMVITDEPGFYVEGSHGIRLENELLCCKGEKNEYGQFMYFDEITLIPMDLDAINPDIMTEEEKKLLNNYHKKVYDAISPYLNEEETEWLAKYTRAV